VSGEVFQVILRTPWAGPWRRFREPVAVVSARNAAEVRPALQDADAAVRDGLYVAGFVTYEAAGAFGLPVQNVPLELPLVQFGCFAPDTIDRLSRFPAHGDCQAGPWTPTVSHDGYLDAIAAIKDAIARGDTYQINYTFRLRGPFEGSASALMRDVFAGQAGGWSAYVDLGTHAICSASPELFFSRQDRRIECRPMKGTAPRGFWADQDEAFGRALQASEKNRAENVMIVDMARNDLGRIARVGSIRADRLCEVERYPSQWQMVSHVTGETDTVSLLRIMEAMFPSGSITGAPKHSAMGIIRDLETVPRGIYTGAIGYVSPRGRSHFSVAIRTVVIDRRTQTAELGVGSGIVWDSVDRDEYDECLLKARVLAGHSPAGAGPGTRPGRRSQGPASYAVPDPPRFRLLETLLWTPDEGFVLLDRHLDRLFASAACFRFDGDRKEIHDLLANAVGDLRGPSKIRIMLEADGGVLCEAVDLSPLPTPMRIGLAGEPIDPADVFLYHKTTRRAVYDRARASRPDVDTPILWNDAGEITESAEANIVLVRGGRRITPPVECGLLPGTRRAELLASGEIEEARVLLEELQAADEIWLVNSVRGWIRAQLVS
jgi:para-aminobenzoate synthetase/4-amino-4-deoxychorismate lyase